MGQLEGDEIDEDEVTRRAVAALRADAVGSNGSSDYEDVEADDVKEERRKVRANNTVVYQNAS